MVLISKTKATIELERDIHKSISKIGVFGCFEVTIGSSGKERVDFLTMDSNNVWRCYEIKSSRSDFYSSAKKTFVGHYNYFVLTKDLYEAVESDIPSHVGVYVGKRCVKRAKRQELLVDEDVLRYSMIRSLAREVNKLYSSEDPAYTDEMNRMINYERREKEKYKRECREIEKEISDKYGRRWRHD